MSHILIFIFVFFRYVFQKKSKWIMDSAALEFDCQWRKSVEDPFSLLNWNDKRFLDSIIITFFFLLNKLISCNYIDGRIPAIQISASLLYSESENDWISFGWWNFQFVPFAGFSPPPLYTAPAGITKFSAKKSHITFFHFKFRWNSNLHHCQFDIRRPQHK
jgi:hypothetical protein